MMLTTKSWRTHSRICTSMKMQMGLLVLLVHLALGLVHLGLVHLGLLVISVERGESAMLICYLYFVSIICDYDSVT